MSEKLVVIGSGGHARSIIDSALDCGQYDVVGVLSSDESDWVPYRGVECIGADSDATDVFAKGCHAAALGIGFMGGTTQLREGLCREYASVGYSFPPIIDPSAVVSASSTIGEGTFIGKRAVLNANSHVDSFSIINSMALVEHDCTVGAFTHIAVGAVLCGGVHIGRGVLVGANATIIQGLDIHDYATIGAASLVLRDVPADTRALGVYNGEG